MFFSSWDGQGRVLIVGVLAYTSLILLLRISGKRTLSKMNAFDLIVTVALGSTLATILLSKDVPLLEGILALGLLIFLQYIITFLSTRSTTISQLVKAEPTLLYHRGQFLRRAMQQQRVVEDEVYAAVCSQSTLSMEQVEAVVLETDGSFSVLTKSDAPSLQDPQSTLHNVSRPDQSDPH